MALSRTSALWEPNSRDSHLMVPDGTFRIAHAIDYTLTDTQGKRYIDLNSGLWVVNVGHGRREIVEAFARQAQNVAYTAPTLATTDVAHAFAEAIIARAPSGFERVFFTTCGSTGVEVALRVARQFHANRGQPKRLKVLCRHGSYHGMTAGALSVTYAPFAQRAMAAPVAPGAVAVPGINCHACPYEKEFPSCDVFCARAIEKTIEAERPETIAAMILEPISAANGTFAPPPAYLQVIRKICDRHGILLIADEVITGLGRAGAWFASDLSEVVPDMIVVAKGLTSGYVPGGAVLFHERVADEFPDGDDRRLSLITTFGGHAGMCAAGLANLEILARENLVDQAKTVGARLQRGLEELHTKMPWVGRPNGTGLLLTLPLVQEDMQPMSSATYESYLPRLNQALRENGLFTIATTAISVAPPLTIDTAVAEEIADRIRLALKVAGPPRVRQE